MYEKEIKIKIDCSGIDEIIESLEASGGRIIKKQREVDIYYQHPCRDFLETDEAVRVRIADGKPESITYKGPRIKGSGGLKKRREVIVNVDDGDPNNLLESLGFKPAVIVEKERIYIEYLDHLVTVDKVESLGCFIEVEGDQPEKILQAFENLGLKVEPIKETYAELMISRGG